MNPIDGEADLTVTGTYIGVYPPRHAWGRWHHLTLTLGLPADAAGIRHQLATGQFKIIRRGGEPGQTTPRHPGGLPPDHAAAGPAAL